MSQRTVRVQLMRSLIGTHEDHRATVRDLGLHHMSSMSELQDTPAVCGMINEASYLARAIS